jgi:hypothetical protein
MTLPRSEATRRLGHRRQIDVQVFARDDGLWEVDARLIDVRPGETRLAGQVRAAGVPIHEMLLRLIVDSELNIVESGAETLQMPYPGQCDDHGDVYERLAGLNLLRGFRQAVRERVGPTVGCTHLTELAQVLPTAVVQAFAGVVIDTRGEGENSERPFQIDRCHALRSDSPAVQRHYPRWYRPASPAVSDPVRDPA